MMLWEVSPKIDVFYEYFIDFWAQFYDCDDKFDHIFDILLSLAMFTIFYDIFSERTKRILKFYSFYFFSYHSHRWSS